MAVFTGIFSYVQLGVAPKIMWAGPKVVDAASEQFGFFGIVLAGCETEACIVPSKGRCTTGVGLGNVIGSTILAYFGIDISPSLFATVLDSESVDHSGPLGICW